MWAAYNGRRRDVSESPRPRTRRALICARSHCPGRATCTLGRPGEISGRDTASRHLKRTRSLENYLIRAILSICCQVGTWWNAHKRTRQYSCALARVSQFVPCACQQIRKAAEITAQGAHGTASRVRNVIRRAAPPDARVNFKLL